MSVRDYYAEQMRNMLAQDHRPKPIGIEQPQMAKDDLGGGMDDFAEAMKQVAAMKTPTDRMFDGMTADELDALYTPYGSAGDYAGGYSIGSGPNLGFGGYPHNGPF
jgi:hypothetical protein